MLMLKISNIGQLMKKLLYENETSFDAFLLAEAKILMGSTFIFDGHINQGFYSDEEILELERLSQSEGHVFDKSLVRWKQIKPHVFSVIKGKKVPQSFSIIFYLSNENMQKLINDSSDSLNVESSNTLPDKLMLRLLYENGILTALTGSVYTTFTTDRSIDKAWDTAVKKFFTSIEIDYEEQ